MASAIIGGKRRVARAELQKKGKNQEEAMLSGKAEKPKPSKKQPKKKY